MKIVFMGTPEFAVPSLRQLLARHDVVAVLTQPDRPAGRGHKLQMSPVKALALEAGVDVLQPETLRIKKASSPEPLHVKNTPFVEDHGVPSNNSNQSHISAKETREYLAKLDADIFVVVAYGLMLPKAVLDMPRYGCVNIHGSVLPKYRGASPIHAAIRHGETTTGITIMQMDTGIDTGDIILQRQLSIGPEERFTSLHDRMAELGGESILEALALIEAGAATRTPQDDAASSYAPMIQKSDGRIDWAWPTSQIINLTRAFDPWPGPFSPYKGETIKIWQVEKADLHDGLSSCIESSPPGTVISADPAKGLLVRTGDGAAWVLELQAAGGKRMAVKDYLRGHSIGAGERLG